MPDWEELALTSHYDTAEAIKAALEVGEVADTMTGIAAQFICPACGQPAALNGLAGTVGSKRQRQRGRGGRV
jgi:hypothetical protein